MPKRRNSMVMSLNEIEETLKRFEEESARIEAERVEIEENIAHFKKMRTNAMRKDGASWAGLKLYQALNRIIVECGRPMTAAEIAVRVKDHGIPTRSKDLRNLVDVTLRSRIKEDGYEFEDGKWALKAWNTSRSNKSPQS